MFTPGTKKTKQRETTTTTTTTTTTGRSLVVAEHSTPPHDSPLKNLYYYSPSVPKRPSTGTPAPWAAPRLSVLARIASGSKADKAGEVDDLIKPVYLGEFPPVVRDEQSASLRSNVPVDGLVTSGGVHKESCLCWIVCGSKLFIWSYLASVASKNCVVLHIPSEALGDGRIRGCRWLLAVVEWDASSKDRAGVGKTTSSVGVVLCNQKTRGFVYWPGIFVDGGASTTPVVNTSLVEDSEWALSGSPPDERKTTPNRQRQRSSFGGSSVGLNSFNSLIASAIPGSAQHACVALSCTSNGELWQFDCSPAGIQCKKVDQDMGNLSRQGSDSGQFVGSKGYPRSLTWRFPSNSGDSTDRQFYLLTDHEIRCYSIPFVPHLAVVKLWSHEIVGTDADLGIKKDLAGQKRIWPLDVQVDGHGRVITVLVATFCKDRVSSSSYTQYSLLTMQYKSGTSDTPERVLEKKAPIQVIIPKARVEDEDFLFSMRLRVGGKPPGSAIILSGDGTATVSHYYRNSTRLYQFDLPNDAARVLDASVVPSTDDSEDGAWVVLTEKAGLWTIPEKAVVLGAVEPPERSLSRKGSSNEASVQEERRSLTFAGNIAPRRASSEASDADDRQRAILTGIARRTAQDEESEAVLTQLFQDFLLTGQVDGSFEKLKNAGAFNRDGEANVFARASKSIVETLAKHWTTTRGVEIVAMTIVSSQLLEKQQKHQRFLQFLALSKCHEELCSVQRQSLQTILEHGEKLAGMIQLRELQNAIFQNRPKAANTPYSRAEAQVSGALWDLIQLVGERARRNTVLLMDRDDAEVFYSKVSDLEEVFDCLGRHLTYLISDEEQQNKVQIERICEISNAIVGVIHAAAHYRNEHHIWYPPPEGLTAWYCLPVVRNGLWRVASFMLQRLNETSGIEISSKSDLCTHLEALSEVLLEANAGAITAKLERGEDQRCLLDEYWERRDSLLETLYHQFKNFVEDRHQIFNVRSDEKNEDILRNLSSNLLSIAKRHEGYNTMWNICCDLNDSLLLGNLMHESMGPKGGFSYFVFEKLYEKKQYSRLLKLGEEFQEELSIFLKHHDNLLWLHELFLHQFSSASETLHSLALYQDDDSISKAEDDGDPRRTGLITTLEDRKRLLNLSKIAAMAGKQADTESKVKRIEADFKLLKLQEEILEILPAEEASQYDGRLFRPEELIQLCLKSDNRELALQSFDVFAWTSSSFRRNHRNLLEECWNNAADQDEWGKLHQAAVIEGWSEEETLQQLRDTVLFQASCRCYGSLAETIDEGFEEVLPLRKESLDSSMIKDFESSVEAVLMQHKDFPDAGKLILTAIMLGSVHDSTKVEESPSPME